MPNKMITIHNTITTRLCKDSPEKKRSQARKDLWLVEVILRNMSCRKHGTVKVVYIDTRYVEVDAKSFKAVVQKLTGKDSCIERINESTSACAKTEMTSSTSGNKFEDVYNIAYDDPRGRDNNNISNGVSMSSKGMSFKESDRLILELPSLEDLQWLYHPIDV